MILSKNKIRLISAAVCASFLLSGCMDISKREFIYVESSSDASVSSDSIGGDLLIVSSETTEAGEEDEEDVNIDMLASFTPQQQEFINSCFFMGDSICSGLGLYGLVRSCAAKAGVAARNIEEFTFDSDGTEVAPLTAIVNSGSKNLVFLMGINDVNIESSEDYCNYYNSFLQKAEALTGNATVYILSITPVTADSSFCYNYQIDEFNQKLKEMTEAAGNIRWYYIDISSDLKDDNGNLNPIYAAEDGLHLTQAAYYVILSAFCREAGVDTNPF